MTRKGLSLFFNERSALILPEILLDVGIEFDGGCPAEAADGLADVLFVVGGNGFVAAVVFVVTLAVEMLDEELLQWMGNALWHVVVHLHDAKWHAYGLVVAVHGTCLGLHRGIVEVDASGNATVLWCIRLQLPSQTVQAQGTCLCVTDGIALLRFFSKHLFAGLGASFFFLHFLMN